MNNRGTQALLKSDIYAINDIVKGNVTFSVSTTDIEGVKKLNLPLNAVLPPIMDIPYERTDYLAKKFGFGRGDLKYKAFALANLFYMFVQAILSVVSIIFVKLGMKAFYRAEVINHVKNCDLVVSYSDENFKEGASLLPLNVYWVVTWESMLIARTWDIFVAKSFGKPVVMFPNSVGPFRTWIGRFLSRLSLNNCDYVLIRDPISYGIVNSLEIRSRKILTSDTALLFKPMDKTVPDDFSHPVIGVSPGIYSHSLSRKDVQNYILAHAKALDTAIEQHGFSVFFLPHYVTGFQYDDLKVCGLILEKMRIKEQVTIINTNTVEEFKSTLDQMDMIISSKMHPAVLGASGYVPTLCVAYDHKQIGFFERLGMIDCTINIREVCYETLSSKIDYMWNGRKRMRALLKRRIPVLQKNIKLALKQALTSLIEAKPK